MIPEKNRVMFRNLSSTHYIPMALMSVSFFEEAQRLKSLYCQTYFKKPHSPMWALVKRLFRFWTQVPGSPLYRLP